MKTLSKHFCILVAVLSFVSCSSNPSKEVATQICQDFVSADLLSMQDSMSEEAKIDIAERRVFLEKFFKSDSYAEMIKDVNCEKPSSVRDTEAGRKIYFFGKQFKIKLKEIEGSWKMVR